MIELIYRRNVILCIVYPGYLILKFFRVNIKRRILDLGIIEGTKIKPVLKSPLGDPTAYEVRGSIISLREEDSKKIEVI